MNLRSALFVAISVGFAAPAFAHTHEFDSCNVESDYRLNLDPQGLRFESDKAQPGRVEMRHGELLVDGRSLRLSAADRARVSAFEDQVRSLVPEVREIALDAIDIAFSAIEQVARTFASSEGDGARTVARMERVHAEARAKLGDGVASPLFNEREFERIIESTVASAIPELVGDITAAAIKAALTGDERVANELERKANRLEREIERSVEQRAKALEQRADSLCPKLTELDRIESALELRLADGRPLNVVSTRR